MPPTIPNIQQNLLDIHHPPIEVTTLRETELTEEKISAFLSSGGPSAAPCAAVGLAGGFSKSGTIVALAASVHSRTLLVQFRSKSKAESDAVVTARKLLQDGLLCNSRVMLVAFDLAPLALALYGDHGLRIRNGVDMQSACESKDKRNPASATEFAVGSTQVAKIFRENITNIFADGTCDTSKSETMRSLAMRSWLAGFLPSLGDMDDRCGNVPKINTSSMDIEKLALLSQFAKTGQLQDLKRVPQTDHDFSPVTASEGKFKFNQERFQTRMRPHNGKVGMTVQDKHGGQFVVLARAKDIAGRNGTLKARGLVEGKSVLSIQSSDDGQTMAEQEKAATILAILQGTSTLFENPFLQTIWPDDQEIVWPEETFPTSEAPPLIYQHPLNNSQQQAVEHMLSLLNSHRISIVQGPPGTGKTTVIGAFVQSATEAGFSGIWLLAQSNVAVKNIAEKLAKIDYLDWRLLVSKDFHLGWHEHLYHQLEQHVIRSDDIKRAVKNLKGVKVILSTLSMLANPRINLVTSKVPIKIMVIDEASQIAVSDYIAPLNNFNTIQKLCFIGDDKQLPPYGQEEIPELQSIFEISHLRKKALFLNTQYRMPPQIGKIISKAVYDNMLKSNPKHEVKTDACFFVDVDGAEKQHDTSWENAKECEVIVQIARKLQEEDASFKIITPYDAQRTLIEKSLKHAGLSSNNKCFNVDSFQGNEDDYIVISVVRSKGLGFLKDLRRTNVMLTRCMKGMFICSSWSFLMEGEGRNSLVGRMAADCGDEAWLSMDDVEDGNF